MLKQRVVAIVAEYLSHRPIGRPVRVRPCGDDDYILGIEDVRDGRVHLLHSLADLEEWLQSFKKGRCIQPAAAICGVCDRLHIDRGLDGELSENCVGCQVELIEVFADLERRRNGF